MIKSKVADQSGDLTIVEDVRGNIQAGASEASMLWVFKFTMVMQVQTLRVQVPNNHILTQNQYYNYLLPKAQVPNYWVHKSWTLWERDPSLFHPRRKSIEFGADFWRLEPQSMQAQLEQSQSRRDSIA